MISKKKTYTKFKYHSEIYQIGESLMVQDENFRYAMCKLLQIIPANGIKRHPYWPTIKIQWYYSKTDLDRAKTGLEDEELFESISNSELFEAPHHDIIYIETVVCKCRVLSFEKYEKLDQPSDTIFFKRSKYDPIKHVLTPSMDHWKKVCKCNRPFNPDLLYMECGGCNLYFHPKCFGIAEGEVGQIDNFYCDNCKNK